MRELNFKTHSHLKNVLGQELINDDNVAVQELVKNSYDAGSKYVKLIFKNLKSNDDSKLNKSSRDKYIAHASKLLVIDEGEGMSETDIEDKWLNIAYSSKRLNKKRKGRILAGDKGVGRFSCDRLGEFLDMYTKTKESSLISHLRIDWNDFEEKQNINDVIQNIKVFLEDSLTPIQLKNKIGYTLQDSGTILEISRLRSDWIEKKGKGYYYDQLVSLKKALEKLTNPNQQIEKDSFKIFLVIQDLDAKDYKSEKTDEYLYLNQSFVINRIFKKLSFKVTEIISEISSDGKEIYTVLKDRDRKIFELWEKNTFTLLKDIKVHLYFLNQYAKAYFKRETGVRSVGFGSIFLFINGFRVPPYGEYGNDWLGLDIRAKQRYKSLFGTREVLGRIEINDNENRFPIVSNREGIVKNNCYNQLVAKKRHDFKDSYVYSAFRKLELFVIEGLDWDKIKDKEYADQYEAGKIEYEPSRELFEKSPHERNLMVLNEVKRIIEITTKKKNIIKLIINTDIIDKIADEEVEKVDKILKDVEAYDTKLDTKTSKGINKIKSTIKVLSKKAEKAETKRKQAESQLGKEKEKAEKAETRLIQVETENIFIKSTSQQDVEQLISLFHHIGIQCDVVKDNLRNVIKIIVEFEGIPNKIITGLSTAMQATQIINTISKIGFKGGITDEMEKGRQDIILFISEFLTNICSPFYSKIEIKVENTIKSKFVKEFIPFEMTYVIDNLISNARKAKASEIVFKFTEEKSNATIEIIDNGNGLHSKIKDIQDIFKRNVSTTRGGAGLGLYDAKKIIKKIGGRISAQNIESGFKITITVPK